MNLIIQPRDGIEPLLRGIDRAELSIEIIIYRLDQFEIEQALVAAAARGVAVHALLTHTNREDLKEIKKLERRLIESGIIVTRTAEDLVRYHSKLMIVDRRVLFLLTFNFTFLDIHHSRSFGIITEETALVAEAVRFFESDTFGNAVEAKFDHFIVSPDNARERLTQFILGAEKELLIYDGKLTDDKIIRHLEDLTNSGVTIKVIGEMDKRIKRIPVRKITDLHLHTQAIIRDRKQVFFGSQSLRKVELEARREIGLITSVDEAVKSFFVIFELDWGDILD
jgi:phosphatidylserine/phosphatidylglycerophosphate/cardiolipin synthase-like enzyme